MEFRINAFVGSLSALREWRRLIPSALVVALTDDLGLVPVTDEVRQDLRQFLRAGARSEEEVIQRWGAWASRRSTLAFISADCYVDFEDDGVQDAVVWTNQRVVQSDMVINKALRLLGVKAEAGKDEFDTVDLGRYKDTAYWAAAAMLGEMPSGAEGVPALIEALSFCGSQKLQRTVRREAAKALGRHGPAAREAIPALVARAKTDRDAYVQEEAARALGLIGREAVPDLIKLMRTGRDGLTRADAATALGDIGKDAREAVPAMIEALREPDKLVRLVAARAMGKMYLADKQLTKTFEALVESATSDPSREVRISAVRTLASVGPEAVPTLIHVLKTESDWLARTDAADGLGSCGREARAAIPALAEALRDQVVAVRMAAAQALGEIKVRDEKAVSALEQALNDDEKYVRERAQEALQKIPGSDSPR
jgi:HEAT repeat protein